MRRLPHILLAISILFQFPDCMTQQMAMVSNTLVRVENEVVYISYDILNHGRGEAYEVWVEISDSKGQALAIEALEGDIGSHIKGGKNKEIIWHPGKDSVFLDEDIGIQVLANIIERPEGSGRGKIIAQSIVFPGLGLSRIDGKPHWIMGVAGYSCIAGSIVFDRMALSSYQEYGSSETVDDAARLLSSAETQTTISNALAFSAIAIWISDLTWTLIATSRPADAQSMSYHRKWRLGSGYDIHTQAPMLSFQYRF